MRERIAKDWAEALRRYRTGRLAEAEGFCRQILARAPTHGEALHLIGTIAVEAGRPADALTPLDQALIGRPDDPALHNLLGTAYLQLDRYAQAIDSLEAALRLRPDFPEARCTLGVALGSQGRSDEAVAAFRAALALNPDMPQAHFNLAGLFAARDRPLDAIAHYREVLRLEPLNAIAHHQLGRSLSGQGLPLDALAHFREAVRLEPTYTEARHNIGVTLALAGHWDEALAQFEDTARREPQSGEAHYNLGSALLLQGKLEPGWAQFEWRWQLDTMSPYRRPFPQPQWQGEDLTAKTILLHDEQGFGDTLQFCRYAPLVARSAAKVYLEIHEELAALLRPSLGSDRVEILARGAGFPGVEGLPVTDFHSPLLSLPNVFRTGLATIPAEIPYLRADPVKIEAWVQRLAPLPHPRIGLIWAGRPGHAQNNLRSLPLARLAPLFCVQGASFLSLQKGDGAAQLADLAPDITIHDFTGDLPDFADTAALLSSIDLVITVDTAMAHLAGALGKPVWLLNRHLPDWRWLLGRDDSPWYPSLRQFRQPAHRDWDSVIAQLAAALEPFVAEFPTRRQR